MCDQSCTYCKKKTHAYILVLKDTCSQTWGNTDVRVCYNRQQLLKSDQCLAFRTFRLWLLAICQKNLWFVSGGDLFKCFISSSGCLSRSLVVCCWPWLQNIIIYVSERGEKKKKKRRKLPVCSVKWLQQTWGVWWLHVTIAETPPWAAK